MKILFSDLMWKGGILSEREVIETLSVQSLPYGGFVFCAFVVLSTPTNSELVKKTRSWKFKCSRKGNEFLFLFLKKQWQWVDKKQRKFLGLIM